MTDVVILDAARTPIGKYGGTLRDVPAVDLGAHAIRTLLERDGIAAERVDDVIMGMVVMGGAGQIPSRQAAIRAGLPPTIPSLTVHKVCASGMRAITLADTMIRAGQANLIIAGGMESMSQVPYASYATRWGKRMGDDRLVDLMIHDGLWCAFDNIHMGNDGDRTAAEFSITREEQDEYACRSQNLAEAAIKEGRLAEEITPFPVPQRKGDPVMFEQDEFPRFGTTLDKLAKLKPAFSKDGTITAGNAPGVNDAGGAVVVTTREVADSLGIKPLARIIDYAWVAVEPHRFPVAPAYSTQKLLEKTGKKLEDIKLLEFNEAFAVVILACGKILNWDFERVNVNGGAIALGHPIGMSGTRVTMTLAYELRRRGGGLGIASICSGGGQGDSILIEVEG
ncbi:MAG: acetyl-CoA acetyltransferase [Planctomycetales bacterium 4484_113]|nr:MAG: acetyl-CoA acetyltransferase [Planctomycetales bacterium 4484_113]